MGKGKRNSLQREQDRVNNSDKHLERQQYENKKSKTDKGVAIACIVFAVLIAASLVFTVLGESGVFIRATDAVSGETVEVNAAMMSFFINDSIMNFYNNNYSYLGYYSLDLSRDLRTQTYGTGYETMFLGEFDGSWYDYFLSTVMDEVEMYVTYAEAAKAAGLTLTEEDEKEIDEVLDSIKETLKASNASYSDWYGKGVKKSDIRKCYELIYLASNFAEHKQAELEAALDEDDSALHTYVEENKGTFYTAEYLSYEISLSSKSFSNDAAFDAAVAAAKAAADKIAEAKTPAEFVQFVEEFEGVDEDETTGASEAEGSDESETESLSPEEELESKIEELKDSISYETGNELGDWIFVEGAQPDDVKVIEETGTETETVTEESTEPVEETTEAESESDSEAENSAIVFTHDTYTVTVYYMIKASDLDHALTKDFAYLATNDKEALEAVLAQFKAGEMTKEKFVEIAEEKYNSIHGDEEHEHSDEELFEYNSVEKTGDGMFNSNYAVMNEWLDSGKLEANTLSEIFEVVVEEKTYYAVVFFESYNVETWYANAYSYTVSEQFENWYEAELEAKPLKINEKAIGDINTIVFTATTTDDGHDH
ncbi:MAG: hypothetical protein IJY39_10685 [Clostridia bacterium]|nr:hypothetical protein [Clostridia bacterium]